MLPVYARPESYVDILVKKPQANCPIVYNHNDCNGTAEMCLEPGEPRTSFFTYILPGLVITLSRVQ